MIQRRNQVGIKTKIKKEMLQRRNREEVEMFQRKNLIEMVLKRE